jgi:hypothetical protein
MAGARVSFSSGWRPIDQEQFLRPGDSLWFPADRDHRYASRRGARGLSVISYPILREA